MIFVHRLIGALCAFFGGVVMMMAIDDKQIWPNTPISVGCIVAAWVLDKRADRMKRSRRYVG